MTLIRKTSKITFKASAVEPDYVRESNPTEPANYTASNTETSKCKAVSRVQTLNTKTKPSGVAIVKELELARPKGEAEK